MRKYENKNKITGMMFECPVDVYCPLGRNYYRAIVRVSFDVKEDIVDFIDIEKYFKQELNGKEYTTEELVGELYDMIEKEYGSSEINVEVESNSHFKIITQKKK